MREPLPRPESVPYNRVVAVDLQAALEREYSKAEWRQATADATARWKAEGHKIERVHATTGRRSSGYYID